MHFILQNNVYLFQRYFHIRFDKSFNIIDYYKDWGDEMETFYLLPGHYLINLLTFAWNKTNLVLNSLLNQSMTAVSPHFVKHKI